MVPEEAQRMARVVMERSGALALYARQWVGDGAMAEDVVQEALAGLLGLRESPRDVVAWMYRAVRNGAIDEARAAGRRRRRERVVAEGRREWFEARVESGLDGEMARRALERLPGEQREVVVLRIWGELGFAQIAEVMASSVSTVHARYVAALTRMRGELERPCVKTSR